MIIASSVKPPGDKTWGLFARARAGDERAWDELFHTYYPMIRRAVRRRLSPRMRSRFDSTDFASDVMKSLAANADRLHFDSPEEFCAYLVEMANSKVNDQYRRAHSKKRNIALEEPLNADNGDGEGGRELPALTPTPSKIAQADEAHTTLLKDQSVEAMSIILLKEAGHSNSEIADLNGWHLRKVQRFFKDLWSSFHLTMSRAG